MMMRKRERERETLVLAADAWTLLLPHHPFTCMHHSLSDDEALTTTVTAFCSIHPGSMARKVTLIDAAAAPAAAPQLQVH